MLTPDLIERTARRVTSVVAGATTEQELLGGVAAALRRAVPYAAASWIVTDPATLLFSDAVIEELDGEVCAPWFHNEFAVPDVHKFAAIAGDGAAVLSRDARREDSARWQELMRPWGYDDELRMTFDDGTGSWGVVELHREVGAPDFGGDEAALVERLAAPVAAGLRRLATSRAARSAALPDGPGLVMVHADGDVSAVTAAGASWLERLRTSVVGRRDARTSLLAVAALVRADGGGDAGRPLPDARIRVRTLDGDLVTVHAEPTLVGEDVAVIIEPSRPADIAGVLARAYGLTPREQEVVVAVARGASTREIAAELYLSPHTVRDHVKAALAKVGVGSRAELVATLFDRHYAPGLFDRVETT